MRHAIRVDAHAPNAVHQIDADVVEIEDAAAGFGVVAHPVIAQYKDLRRNQHANRRIQDRRGRNILSIRDQNTFDVSLRRKRLMTLAQLFLLYRYKIDSVHYLTPTEDNHHQTDRMKARGVFSKNGRAELWLTNDERRLMVRMETHLAFGTISLRLREFTQGLPQP